MSPKSTSSMEPMEMKWLKPTLPMAARSRLAVPMAPLCEMKPMMPCAGMPGMKLALSFLAGRITPRQLGPMMRRPEPSKAPLICSSIRRPSSPSSRPPAAMMITPRVPARTHWRTTSGVMAMGTATMARSVNGGASVMAR